MYPQTFLISALLLCAILQIIYLFRYWARLAFYKPKSNEVRRTLEPVSVIIAARNEEKNLKIHLKAVLEQEYPTFEVIVVNDCSNDDSYWVLEEYLAAYPEKLRVVTLVEQPKYPTTKKFALTMGIKASKYDTLLFIDADTLPETNQWIQHMQNAFSSKIELVLSYSPYKKKASVLNLFIQFDTFLTGLNYLSYALAKNAYMGVGRNLAYLKGLFFYHKGFSSHIKHYAGDDDLFVNQAATKNNVAICLNPAAFTISEPKTTWISWIYQKTRHASTAKFYKTKHQFSLIWGPSVFWLTNLFLLIAWLNAPFSNLFQNILIVTTIVIFLFRWGIMAFSAFKLKEQRVILFLPFLEIIFPIIQLVFTIWGLNQSKRKW